MIYWNTRDVVQLLDPLTYHHKAGLVEHNRSKEALRLINKYWDPAIVVFFYAHHESEKTLCQLGQVARESFSYVDARVLVNSRIVKKILSCQSTPQIAFKTRTCNQHQLETIDSPPVTFACLVLANLYYGPFGELLEGLLPTDVHGYTGHCYYSQYGQLFQGLSPFLIPLIPISAAVPAAIDVDGSGSTGNRMNTGSGRGRDAGNDGSAIVGAGNRTNTRSSHEGDIRDNGLAVVGGNDGPVVVDD